VSASATQFGMNAEIRQRMAQAEQEKKRLEQEMQAITARAQAAEAAEKERMEKERMDKQALIDTVKSAQEEELRQLREQMETFKDQADAKAKEVWRLCTAQSAQAAGNAGHEHMLRLLHYISAFSPPGSIRRVRCSLVTRALQVADSDLYTFSPEECQRLMLENIELKRAMTMLDDLLKHQVCMRQSCQARSLGWPHLSVPYRSSPSLPFCASPFCCQLAGLLTSPDEGARFGMVAKGELDIQVLRNLGLKKLPTTKQVETGLTEEQLRWTLEVEAWGLAIIGAEQSAETILPWLEPDSAFIGDGAGKYVEVREEMEVFVQKKKSMKLQTGEIRVHQPPPITKDPKFFNALKKHVRPNVAKKIMEYIMETYNEYMANTHAAVRTA
jgi:hypothetical protein